MLRAALVAAFLATGCHTIVRSEIARPGKTTIVERRETPVGKRPTIAITDAGMLRFAELLECGSDEVVEQTNTVELHKTPNLAAFVVGIAATSVGGIAFATSAAGHAPTGNPIFYAGAIGLVVGLPFAIGPWIGQTTELQPGPPLPPIRRPGPTVPCGEHPITAASAIVTVDETDVYGKVDADGVFSISPYELHDAFAPNAKRAWNVSAALDGGNGMMRIVTAVIDPTALAAHAPAWLAKQSFDRTIQPIRLVPGLEPGTLRVSLTSTASGPAIRVVLAIKNAGPGEAWAVRGQIATPVRAIDRRMLYFGHLAKGELATREIIIPIGADVASIMRNTTVMISVELHDAHGTAPATPVRFNGQVLVDLPR